MSTLKSNNENMTINADGASSEVKFQANGVEKASISAAGAFTSTTIDATALTGNLPAISGASLTGLADNTPSFRASGAPSYTNATWQTMIADTEQWDTDSAYDTSTGEFTCPEGEAGKYMFTAYSSLIVTNGSEYSLVIRKNTSAIATSRELSGYSGTVTSYITTTGIIDLGVGDTVDIRIWSNGGSGTAGIYFGGFKLIGV